MKIKLYKIINEEIRLIDYGVKAHINTYTACGYIVVLNYNDTKEAIWKSC